MKSNKTKTALTIASLLVAILIFGFSYAFGTQETPKVVVSEPEFEFSSVPEGAVVIHEFVIQNRKEQTLTIFEVRSS
jgi:hypothetical protein